MEERSLSYVTIVVFCIFANRIRRYKWDHYHIRIDDLVVINVNRKVVKIEK